MNERQRDLFLWLWSQRRTRGAARVARHGALIGAGGGLLFSALMMSGMGTPAGAGATGLSAILPLLERAATLLLMTVPALACVGYFKARHMYHLQERMFQSMLLSGARVPARRPVMQAGDRWPAVAVGVTVALIAGFVLALVWAASSGRL